VHVPYKGAAPAAQDLAAGHVSMMFDVVVLALPQIKAGRVRALGVAAKERVAVLPAVPTLTEQGFPAEVGGWFGVLAPAGTPPEAIAWLNRETTKVFSAPDTRDRFVQQGRRGAARHAGDIRQVHRSRICPLWRHHPARRDQARINSA
jgi:tripartite-type tricarboxylate transporter receptor subunit TctC